MIKNNCLPLLHGYINEGDKRIFENTRARACYLRQTSFIRIYQHLLIIIVIPNAYYVDTHIDICCESKRVNSAHMRVETFENIAPPSNQPTSCCRAAAATSVGCCYDKRLFSVLFICYIKA